MGIRHPVLNKLNLNPASQGRYENPNKGLETIQDSHEIYNKLVSPARDQTLSVMLHIKTFPSTNAAKKLCLCCCSVLIVKTGSFAGSASVYRADVSTCWRLRCFSVMYCSRAVESGANNSYGSIRVWPEVTDQQRTNWKSKYMTMSYRKKVNGISHRRPLVVATRVNFFGLGRHFNMHPAKGTCKPLMA